MEISVSNEKNQPEPESPRKQVVTIVTSIAGFAFGTLVLGSLVGAPWPAAVASCGISATGLGVAYLLLRRD